jgi:hypothetical protein
MHFTMIGAECVRTQPVTWLEEQSDRQGMLSHIRRPMTKKILKLTRSLVPELNIQMISEPVFPSRNTRIEQR